jgi:multidrug efflux pump subunit AcrA (membrane-fusion protein)
LRAHPDEEKPMKSTWLRLFLAVVLVLVIGRLGCVVADRVADSGGRDADERPPAPVEVSVVEHGAIELRRTFSGTLDAPAEFVVSPKVGGRIERLMVDLADVVTRGQIVAELDNEEYAQAVAQVEAELAVAQAELVEAKSSLEIAKRELERMTALRDRGIASESQFDAATVEHLARKADAEVARAVLTRAKAALETAHIRLGYTKVPASWTGRERALRR